VFGGIDVGFGIARIAGCTNSSPKTYGLYYHYRSYSVIPPTRAEARLDTVRVALTDKLARFRLSGDVCSPLALLRTLRPLYCFSCGPSAQSSSGGEIVSANSGRLLPSWR
jgi:hypothetical protein